MTHVFSYISFSHNVLQITNDISEPGSFRVPLVITLALAWILCYFCIWKGIQWTGKVYYYHTLYFNRLSVCILDRLFYIDVSLFTTDDSADTRFNIGRRYGRCQISIHT